MHDTAEVVLEVFEAIEQRDREKLLELCDERVELHEAPSLPYGGLMQGKEMLREQLETSPQRTWLGTWGPLQPTEQERRMDPRVVTTGGAEVVVSYRQRAVGADGERFDAPVLAIYEVRDGKFARAQMFHYDTAAIVDFLERATASR
jgi:ketosteroid isomerase-like protein